MKKHRRIIAVGIFLFFIGFCVNDAISTHSAAKVALLPPQQPGAIVPVLSPSDIDISQLYMLVNQDRTTASETQLRLNPALNASASAKCADMVAQNYWAHDAPDGTTPWHFFTEAGVPYHHWGENLAENFDSAILVNDGWLKSPEHKANILDPLYTDVGFGVCKTEHSPIIPTSQALVVVQHLAQY